MKLGMFMMPLHPPGRNAWETLAEDREAILLADRLGFEEAFVGEHVTDLAENVTSSLMFLASVAHATTQIRLGTGTINMPNTHPANDRGAGRDARPPARGAASSSGISPGGLMSDAEVFGNYEKDRNAIFLESIDMVLEIWKRDGPYDLHGEHFHDLHRQDDDPRDRAGHDPQAVPEAASADRGHGRGAALEGRDRGGQARLDADLGELPAARVGRIALAALRRGPRGRRRDGRSGRLARRQVHLRGRRRGDARSATASPPKGRTTSTSSSCCASWSAPAGARTSSSSIPASPTPRSRRSASPTSS